MTKNRLIEQVFKIIHPFSKKPQIFDYQINDKIHNILDILADEELYLLNIRFITNLQTFPSQFNHFSQSRSNCVFSRIYFPCGKSSQHVSRRSCKWSREDIKTLNPLKKNKPNYSWIFTFAGDSPFFPSNIVKKIQ